MNRENYETSNIDINMKYFRVLENVLTDFKPNISHIFHVSVFFNYLRILYF